MSIEELSENWWSFKRFETPKSKGSFSLHCKRFNLLLLLPSEIGCNNQAREYSVPADYDEVLEYNLTKKVWATN
jgi:hypothetical protein